MKVFVINLRDHAERRESSARKLAAAGVAFEFFEAITGDDARRLRAFRDYDADEFRLNTGRTMAPGEIGCFASHRALWDLCCRINEPVLVMEDDFDLLDGFDEAVSIAGDLTTEFGFLRLQTDLRARRYPILARGEFEVSRFTKAPHSTMCYAISPAAAAVFLQATRVMDAPVDVFIKKFWEHGQALHALTPYTVAPSVLSVASTISGRTKEATPFGLSLRRFLRKGNWYARRFLFNVDQRWISAPDLRHSSRPATPAEEAGSAR